MGGSFCFILQAEEHKVAWSQALLPSGGPFGGLVGDTRYIRKSLPPQHVLGIGLTFILSEGGG